MSHGIRVFYGRRAAVASCFTVFTQPTPAHNKHTVTLNYSLKSFKVSFAALAVHMCLSTCVCVYM